MSATLRVLLSEIIDYAGLFPPAQLALQAAIRSYGLYRDEPESWMLGRFICPAARLGELDELGRELFLDPPHAFRFSALGRGGDATTFLPALRDDLHEINAFHASHRGRARVEAFEVPLPPALLTLECTGELVRLLENCRAEFRAAQLETIPLACEASPGAGPAARAALDSAIGALVFHNTKLTLENRGLPQERTTLKVRCGGVEASSFPSAELLAFAITRCRDSGVSTKFTAGLHHPLRRRDSGMSADVHGFINVFAACVFAHVHDIDSGQVESILETRDPAGFTITEEGLRWGELLASPSEIRDARERFATSFGSCSFDEPREDLRALGWLLP